MEDASYSHTHTYTTKMWIIQHRLFHIHFISTHLMIKIFQCGPQNSHIEIQLNFQIFGTSNNHFRGLHCIILSFPPPPFNHKSYYMLNWKNKLEKTPQKSCYFMRWWTLIVAKSALIIIIFFVFHKSNWNTMKISKWQNSMKIPGLYPPCIYF